MFNPQFQQYYNKELNSVTETLHEFLLRSKLNFDAINIITITSILDKVDVYKSQCSSSDCIGQHFSTSSAFSGLAFNLNIDDEKLKLIFKYCIYDDEYKHLYIKAISEFYRCMVNYCIPDFTDKEKVIDTLLQYFQYTNSETLMSILY